MDDDQGRTTSDDIQDAGKQAFDRATKPIKDKAVNDAKNLAKKGAKKVGNAAKSKAERQLGKASEKVLGKENTEKVKGKILDANQRLHRFAHKANIRRRIRKKAHQMAEKARKRVKKALIKMMATIAKFLLHALPYIVAGLVIFMITNAIWGWLLNRDLTQRFTSYNYQEDSMDAENPYNVDRDGNYVTLAKNMSNGNKMYFIYYAYNARHSWYVADVAINRKTKKEVALDWQDDNFVKQILGMSQNSKLNTEVTKGQGSYGNAKLLNGDSELYQKVLSKRLGTNTKTAIASFTMNTNMLYLLDQSLNRPGTGGTNQGFYFSEQFTKPMYTGELFNYKSLIDRKTGKWNAKSWVMDTEYRPKTEKLVVTSAADNPKHEPSNKVLQRVDVKRMEKELKALSKREGRNEQDKTVVLDGPTQMYSLYEGPKDYKHPYPYKKGDSAGFRQKDDSTATDPAHMTAKEKEELYKKEHDRMTIIKDYLDGYYMSYKNEAQKYQDFKKDYANLQKASKPTRPDFRHFVPRSKKVTANEVAHQLGFTSYKSMQRAYSHKHWWEKLGHNIQVGWLMHKLPVQDALLGHDSYVPSTFFGRFTAKSNGDLIDNQEANKSYPLFIKGGRKIVEDAVKNPNTEYNGHKHSTHFVAKDDVGKLFDRYVNPEVANYQGKMVPWGKNQRLLKGWVRAWRAYYVKLQQYNMHTGGNAKQLLDQEKAKYTAAATQYAKVIDRRNWRSVRDKLMAHDGDPKNKIWSDLYIITHHLFDFNHFFDSIQHEANKDKTMQQTTLRLNAPDTTSGRNLTYTNGVWNYGFGSIIKFAQFPISYAEKIDWDAETDAGTAGIGAGIGKVDVTGDSKTAIKEARAVATALGKKLHISPKLIFGQMGFETGFSHVAARYNLSGVKWVPGDPADEKGSMSPEGDPYRAFKSSSEYAEVYGNIISKFLQGKHPTSAEEYVQCLKHGPNGQQYFTDPNVQGYINGVKSYSRLYHGGKDSVHVTGLDVQGMNSNTTDVKYDRTKDKEQEKRDREAREEAKLDKEHEKESERVKYEEYEKDLNKQIQKVQHDSDYLAKNGHKEITQDSVSDVRKQKNIEDFMNKHNVTSQGPASSASGKGTGRMSGTQYGYYKLGKDETIYDGDQGKFSHNPTLNQHNEYFLTGVTTPVGSVDLTKTLYYGHKGLPKSYIPFDKLQKSDHGLPNKKWSEDDGDALHTQKVYDTVLQRDLYTKGDNRVLHAFPNSEGNVSIDSTKTDPAEFRPNNGKAKKANGNVKPNGNQITNVYHTVQSFKDKYGKSHTFTTANSQTAQVTLISDAPKIDSETWKEITKPAISQFKDINHGTANIQTQDFSLHGSEYFRQYMMNYATYVPDGVENANNFNLSKELNMFETGSSFESNKDKKQRYANLTKMFYSGNTKSSNGGSDNIEKGGSHMGNIKMQAVQKYAPIIEKYGNKYGVDPDLIAAIVAAESGGRLDAENPSGAFGLMQSLGTGNPVPVYDFDAHHYHTWTKLSKAQLKGSADRQVYNGVAEMAYRLSKATNSAKFDQAMQGYGGGAEDGWRKWFAGKGGVSKIWWKTYSGGKAVTHYYDGHSTSSNETEKPNSGSDNDATGSAINNMANSVMDNVKGFFSNFSNGYKKVSHMGSVWQSMFHHDNYSKSVDIWTFDHRNNDIFNAINKSYVWFNSADANVHMGNTGSDSDQHHLYIKEWRLERLTGKANDSLSIVNNGAQMYSWQKYENNLSYDQFLTVLRAYDGLEQSALGRKTTYDDTPDDESQISYNLDNNIINVFGDIYIKGGALNKLDKLKKVLKLAYGKYDANVVGQGTPTIAGVTTNLKSLNKTDDDANATMLDDSPEDPKSPGDSTLEDRDLQRMAAYSSFNDSDKTSDDALTASEGTFNGKNVQFTSTTGEEVKAFAGGKVVRVTNNTVQINNKKGSMLQYDNIQASVHKGQTVKAGDKVGKVSDQGQLQMTLEMPAGYIPELDINQNALAHIVKSKAMRESQANDKVQGGINKGQLSDANQTIEYDNETEGGYCDPSLLYTPVDSDGKPTSVGGNPNGAKLVAEAEKWIGKLPYGTANIDEWRNLRSGMSHECSDFIWSMMKRIGYKTPATHFTTPSMEDDAKHGHHYFKQISAKDAGEGDIVVVNLGGGMGANGHTAILREHWHGDNTKIVNEGGSGENVNNSTFATSFYPSLRGGRITFMRPIGK